MPVENEGSGQPFLPDEAVGNKSCLQMEEEKSASIKKTQTVLLLPDEQIAGLRLQMLENQASSYHQKLQSSQEAQHQQAILVKKLQAKVLQYRNWCKELEKRLEDNNGSHTHQQDHKVDRSLENMLVQLEEEQQRCENLAKLNMLLREHLDKGSEVNGALQEDINKLTDDWIRAKDELEHKESEWRKEREFFEHYMRTEQDRILGIWRQVVTLRRHFLEMKTATDRDLSEFKAEQMRLHGSIMVNCFHVSSDVQFWEKKNLENLAPRYQLQEQKQIDKKSEKIDIEEVLHEKAKAIMTLHVKRDLAKEDLQSRVQELTSLLEQSQKQNEEKEETVKALRATVEILVWCQRVQENPVDVQEKKTDHLKTENDQTSSKKMSEEILSLQHMIKEIVQAVVSESESDTIGISQAERYADFCSVRQLNSGDSDGALHLVRNVLTKRNSQMQQLRQQLLTSHESVTSLEKQQKLQEEHCNFLRNELEQLKREQDTSANQLQHLQAMLETYRSDCTTLEKSKKELQQQLEVLEQETQRLRQSNTELQLKGDIADGEKEEKQEELERMMRQREYIQEDRNALEEKYSLLRNELVAMRESLEKSHLEGELMKQEKEELASALGQTEESLAKLTSAHNKLNTETAELHCAVTKMSALNEALALDKVSLNQLILKLEQENQALLDKADILEKRGTSLQKQLTQTERTKEELKTEKFHLEQLLHKAEELQESNQNELRVLSDDKKEACEKLSQVCHQYELSNTSLEQANQELNRIGEMLSRVSREKESLMREKTALEVRLAVVERDRLTVTEQVSQFRSAKDVLESSLFLAQQQLSQLEVTRDQLEMKIQAVSQAKEVIQGEVKCLCDELEASKSQVEQEREEKAQQLLLVEHKYQETLNLCCTAHKEEMDTVFQKLESERECHKIEFERVVKEKEETESVCEIKLLEMKQKITDIQTHMEEELNKAESVKQEVLLEKENEKKSLQEELLHTNKKLVNSCQQLEDLHQEMKEHQEREQNTIQTLEAVLKDTQNTMETLKVKHKEETKSLKEEINVLLHQQNILQNQIQELELQLLTTKDSCKLINQEAQQHLKETQELSEQKELEIVYLQKMLETEGKQREEALQQILKLQRQKEEFEQRITELKALLQSQQEEEKQLNKKLLRKGEEVEHQHTIIQTLERKQSQWEEAERWNTEQHTVLQRQWEETKSQIKQLQNQQRDTELQNIELQHQKEEVEHKNAQLRALLQRQQEEAEHESAVLQSHWEKAQQRCSELQNWKEKIEHQNAEFQALLHNQQEEMECKETCIKKEQSQNLELKASLQALEQERASLAVSLEKEMVRLKKLQERDDAHQDEITTLNSALNQAKQMLAEHEKEKQELNSQMESLKQMMVEKETALVAHKVQLIEDLEVSRANEQLVKNTVQTLEAELSQLRLSLCSTESRAEALASECQRSCSVRWEAEVQLKKLHSVFQYMLFSSPETSLKGQGDQNFWSSSSLNKEQDHVKQLALSQLKDSSTELTAERVAEAIQDLRKNLWQARLERDEAKKNSETLKHELGEKEAERECISARAEELQKWMNQCQEEKSVAEGKRGSLESALKKEIIAFKEENVRLHGKVTHLEKLLESTEQQRKDVVNERDTLQMAKEKLARELDLGQESFKASELQVNAMEKMNKSLEQELETALSILRSKHEEVETHQKRLVALQKEAEVGRTLQEIVDHLNITLGKRNEEIKDHLQQIRDLEILRDVQEGAVEHLTKNLEKRSNEIDSQKKQIEEMRNQNEMQKSDLKKLNLELEDTIQALKSQQEKFEKLQELLENQKIIIESMSLNLEETVKENKIKEEKIQIMENNESLQIQALLKDLDDTKIRMNERDWELASQKQLLLEWKEQGQKREKSLYASLDHMKAALRDKEREVESQREQISCFQQHEAQREEHLSELSEKVKEITLTLTQRELELEAQKKQIKEMERDMEIELTALREHTAKTQGTLMEKNTELELQRKHEEEEVKSQIRVLLEDIQYSTAVLKEKDDNADVQNEQIKQLEKQMFQETTLNMLKQLKICFKKRQQELQCLKEQHEKFTEDKIKLIKELQTDLQQAKQALKNGEFQIKCLTEENLQQIQQQEAKALAQVKSISDKLDFARSSLQGKEKEIESLQMCVKELSEQKGVLQHDVSSLQQDLNRVNQLVTEKEEEILKQAQQISMYQLKVKDTTTGQMNEEDLKCQHRNEQEDQKHLQEQKELSEERNKKLNCQDERSQKPVKDGVEEHQEHIQHPQFILKKKDCEIELQRKKTEQLEKILKDKEKELLNFSEQLKQIISTLGLEDYKENNFHSCIEKITMWKEEEVAQSKAIKEKDQSLERQEENIQLLEREKRINRQALNHITAVLKQTESGEIEWREKAQKLSLSLAQSEEAVRVLKKEMAVTQNMISERDRDRLHLQEQLDAAFKALMERFNTKTPVEDEDLPPRKNNIAEMFHKEAGEALRNGELTWMAEKRFMYRHLHLLQQAVARLENDKHGLMKHNIQLKDALEEVERERRRLKKSHGSFSVSSEFPQPNSALQKSSSLAKKETQALHKQLAELQNQVFVLQSQLLQERKQKQNYIISCTKTNQELSDLHQELADSLAVVATKPESTILESETRKLDETLSHSLALVSLGQDGMLSGKHLVSSTPRRVQQKPTR